MKPHQERVIQERKELAEKRDKLNTFLTGDTFKTLDEAEQKRLIVQCGWMNGYLDTLDERIACFVK
jgi:hypothetical protein